MRKDWYEELYAGLRALAESAFPKTCASCGRRFATVDEFLRETEVVRPDCSGLKQSCDADNSTIVELFRNCSCGSTMMDYFSDRRDLTERGKRRRERFGRVLHSLEQAGISRDDARRELLKTMHGEKSELLANIKPDSSPTG